MGHGTDQSKEQNRGRGYKQGFFSGQPGVNRERGEGCGGGGAPVSSMIISAAPQRKLQQWSVGTGEQPIYPGKRAGHPVEQGQTALI